MIEYIKKAFRNYWLLSVFCVVVGIALIVNPQFFTSAIGYAVGGFFGIYGILKIVTYFVKKEEYSTNLVTGIILTAAGIFLIFRPDFIPKTIAVIFGRYMIFSGIVSIQDSLNLKNSGIDNWQVSCISAVVTTIVGIILVFNPLAPVNIAFMLLGICLVVSGVSNIIGCSTAGSKLRKFEKDIKNDKKHNNDDFIDI